MLVFAEYFRIMLTQWAQHEEFWVWNRGDSQPSWSTPQHPSFLYHRTSLTHRWSKLWLLFWNQHKLYQSVLPEDVLNLSLQAILRGDWSDPRGCVWRKLGVLQSTEAFQSEHPFHHTGFNRRVPSTYYCLVTCFLKNTAYKSFLHYSSVQ